ncbi:hypothetical protein KO494_00700 [Lacinutrix sp. C3R15]|uniref:hypothetical protein n=1 Tax=Flavobacteriaceae TaxID=49546 RepID=UPI001C09D1F0|nr:MULTISPECIES: hypothetical protein [Flavobacteriaceae]MBU2938044.1 hypothetical protein [Lacinutrix sp. C3R15]MDO6621358.1 hypothetical protein [Oceanihabitans sp. 1_MG-2023]
MSEKQTETSASDEIDLGQLFNVIGSLFDRFTNFIKSIFKGILSFIVSILRVVIKNFKIILITVLVSGILGYVIEKIKPATYGSSMLVKPYFDSKFQLVTNIDYFNALIGNKDYTTLSNIFHLDQESVKQIKKFEIAPGPETENDRIIQYDKFIKSIDSIRAADIEFEDFVENRSIYSGDFYEINVESYKKDIFSSLEKGLNSSFTNEYSLKKMKKRDSLIIIQKENILASIQELDSLQQIYVNVLNEEAKSGSGNINFDGGYPLKQEKSNTKEYELLNQQLKLRTELRVLEEKKIEEDVFFDTISSFQKIGTKSDKISEKYSLIFPILAVIFLLILHITVTIVKFVNAYGKE